MGVDARGFPGGLLRLNPAFALCRASFLMTFAMGGVPHACPQHDRVLFTMATMLYIATLILIYLIP